MKLTTIKILCLCLLSSAAVAQITPMQKNAPESQPIPTNEQPTTDVVPKKDDLEITDAYVQPLLPGQNSTAAYMEIKNYSKERYQLKGAYSSIADKTEIHTVINENGVIRMRGVGKILLLPGEAVRLQPGDLHIMLIGVKELNQDMQVPICLEFEDSDAICIQVPVRDKRGEAGKANASANTNANATAHAH